jgi:hypothetical protein
MGWLGEVLLLNDFDWAEGIRLMAQSVALNPNDAAILARYGIFMEKMQLEGSGQVLERAFQLDPFGMVPTAVRVNHLARSGRWLDAATLAETQLIGDRNGYTPNNYAAFLNLAAAHMGGDREAMREARLVAAEEQIRRARLVAHPTDVSLDDMEMMIAALRNDIEPAWRELLTRGRTGRVDHLLPYSLHSPWGDIPLMVALLELAIEQRDSGVCGVFFGAKPPQLPEAEWQRLKEKAGVARYQLARGAT